MWHLAVWDLILMNSFPATLDLCRNPSMVGIGDPIALVCLIRRSSLFTPPFLLCGCDSFASIGAQVALLSPRKHSMDSVVTGEKGANLPEAGNLGNYGGEKPASIHANKSSSTAPSSSISNVSVLPEVITRRRRRAPQRRAPAPPKVRS